MIEGATALWFVFQAARTAAPTMLEILRNLQKSAPISFSLVAVEPRSAETAGFPEHILPAYLQLGVEYKIVEENTYGIVKERSRKEKPPARCALACVAAYSLSYRHRARGDQDRLGHHRDDILQAAV